MRPLVRVATEVLRLVRPWTIELGRATTTEEATGIGTGIVEATETGETDEKVVMLGE